MENGELSYYGIIKNKEVTKIKKGHASHTNCKSEYTFHIHPQTYTCSCAPSSQDIVFVYLSHKDYNLKIHYVATPWGLWKLYPQKKIKHNANPNHFSKKYEGKNCRKLPVEKHVKEWQKDANSMGFKCKHIFYENCTYQNTGLKKSAMDTLKYYTFKNHV